MEVEMASGGQAAITGFKLSGYGTENGIEGMHSVTRLKHLAVSHG